MSPTMTSPKLAPECREPTPMTKTVSVTISGTDEELVPLFAFLAGRTVVNVDDRPIAAGAMVGMTATLTGPANEAISEPALEDHSPAERAADAVTPEAEENARLIAEKHEAKKTADRERKKVKRAEAKAAKEAAAGMTMGEKRDRAHKDWKDRTAAKGLDALEAEDPLLDHPDAAALLADEGAVDAVLEAPVQDVTTPPTLAAMSNHVRSTVKRIGKTKGIPAVKLIYAQYGETLLAKIDPSNYAELLEQLGDL